MVPELCAGKKVILGLPCDFPQMIWKEELITKGQ